MNTNKIIQPAPMSNILISRYSDFRYGFYMVTAQVILRQCTIQFGVFSRHQTQSMRLFFKYENREVMLPLVQAFSTLP